MYRLIVLLGYKNKSKHRVGFAYLVKTFILLTLSRSNVDSLEKAIDLARKQLQAVVTQVQTFLDIHQVISAGPFLYTFIQEVGTLIYQ